MQSPSRKEYLRIMAKNRRANAKKRGLCMFCFKNKPAPDRVKCEDCADYIKASQERVKLAAFNAYGGPVCICCGETNIKFLTIDHVDSDGAKQRKETNQRCGNSMHRWLKKNNYPPGFQVLCWNCNCGRAYNGGICPHKERYTNAAD